MLRADATYLTDDVQADIDSVSKTAAIALAQAAVMTEKALTMSIVASGTMKTAAELTAVASVLNLIMAGEDRIIVAADCISSVFFQPFVARGASNSLDFETVEFDALAVPIEMQRLLVTGVDTDDKLRNAVECLDTWHDNPGCIANPLAFVSYGSTPKIDMLPDCKCPAWMKMKRVDCPCQPEESMPLRCTCLMPHTVPQCMMIVVTSACIRMSKLCAGWKLVVI